MTSSTAKFSLNEIQVQHSVRVHLGFEHLTVDAPNGWADVKKLTGKILTFDGRRFGWVGWNSDRNVAYFRRDLDGSFPLVATVSQ